MQLAKTLNIKKVKDHTQNHQSQKAINKKEKSTTLTLCSNHLIQKHVFSDEIKTSKS